MLRSGEYSHKELHAERLTPAEDPSIPAGHRRTIVHSVPAFWVDGSGEKRPVDLDAVEGAEDGHVKYGCVKNSLQSSCRADGWVTTSCIDGTVRYRVSKQKHTQIGPPDFVALPDVAPISGFSKNANTVNTVRGDIEIQTEILPGSLKDTIAIARISGNVDRGQPIGVVFEYQSDLTPVKIGEEIHWQNGETETILRWKAPVGWDANGADIPLEYELDFGAGEITLITVGGVAGHVLPLYFDPTTTTGFSDGNRSVYVRDQTGTGEFEQRHSMYLDVNAISIEGDTLTAAELQWLVRQLDHSGGSGPNTLNVDVFCDDISLLGKSAAILGSTSWSAKTESTTITHVVETKTFDIFGAVGVNGAAKIYDDGGANIAVFIFWTDATELDYDVSNDTWPQIGQQNTEGKVQFYSIASASNYPRIELTHAPESAFVPAPNNFLLGGGDGF